MKKIILALLALSIVGGVAWTFRAKLAKPPGAFGRVIEASEGPIEETIDATGAVAPLNRVEIKPPISGRIERLLVEEGTRVQAGQALAWMSSSDRAAILDAALAKGPQEHKKWQDAYKPTPILAPLSGVVILRNAVVGQTVDVGTVLFAMSDTLIVLAQVDESAIGKVRLGMPVRIWLDAYPDEKVPAGVSDILFEGKNVSNVITYGVKVKPERVPDFFRSQMTANVSFIVRRKANAVLLPAAAVKELPDGSRRVLIPGPEGKPVPRAVETGVENGESVEIVSGLRPGDAVLLTRGRYKPQQAIETSPLMPGRRPNAQVQGQAPSQRRNP